MLNEREHMNMQMYDTLSDKLTDEVFIGTAIDNNEKNDVKNTTLVGIKADSKGPFDRRNNPFEQFRNGPPMGGSSGPFDRNNNPFEQFRTTTIAGPVIFNSTTKKQETAIRSSAKTRTSSSSSVSWSSSSSSSSSSSWSSSSSSSSSSSGSSSSSSSLSSSASKLSS
jgi:hypothetical protein